MVRRAALLMVLVLACATQPPTPGPTSNATASPTPHSTMPTSAPTAGPTAAPSPPALRNGTYRLVDVLPLLEVSAEDRTGYMRTTFRLWVDADHDGCNTRKEVLLRDAVAAPSISLHCALFGGQWVSPYDGITFTDESGLDIDHVVPLAEAWDSGASVWAADEREAYANDLGVPFALLAVSAHTNRSKGDADPANWLPRSVFVCQYLADWVGVKARWSLTVDPPEHAAIAAHSECDAVTVTVVLAEAPA